MKFSTMSTVNNTKVVISKEEIAFGDRIWVRTRNSIYELQALRECRFKVSGGWFNRKKRRAVHTTVTGCSIGGTSVKNRIIAECGCRIEFGNQVVTSPIYAFVIMKGYQLN